MQGQAEGGGIVNIASVSGVRPSPGTAVYGAAKAGLLSLTESLAMEWGPKVRVNALIPGPFLTDIAQAWTEEARREQPVSLGRPGEPAEIVTAALMLASPASSFTTGALVQVDGGPR